MREYQVRICEGLGVKFPGPTRQTLEEHSASPPRPIIPQDRTYLTGRREVRDVPVSTVTPPTAFPWEMRRKKSYGCPSFLLPNSIAGRGPGTHEQTQMLEFPATDALARGGMCMAGVSDTDPDAFISAAIETGARDGVEALDADQRLVFLISEAEVLCDKDGIDTFLDHYRPRWLADTAAAFAAVGATEIAAALGAITLDAQPDDPLLDRANELITSGQATATRQFAKPSRSASQGALLDRGRYSARPGLLILWHMS